MLAWGAFSTSPFLLLSFANKASDLSQQEMPPVVLESRDKEEEKTTFKEVSRQGWKWAALMALATELEQSGVGLRSSSLQPSVPCFHPPDTEKQKFRRLIALYFQNIRHLGSSSRPDAQNGHGERKNYPSMDHLYSRYCQPPTFRPVTKAFCQIISLLSKSHKNKH